MTTHLLGDAAQVMHAMCIKTESEHYRRCKDKTAGGYAMGAIYWQACAAATPHAC